jgi:hypothetical protein
MTKDDFEERSDDLGLYLEGERHNIAVSSRERFGLRMRMIYRYQ